MKKMHNSHDTKHATHTPPNAITEDWQLPSSLERPLLHFCAPPPSLRVNEGSRALVVSSFDVGVRLRDERGPRPPLPSCSRCPDQFARPVVVGSCYPGFIPRFKNRRLRGVLCPHPHAPRLNTKLSARERASAKSPYHALSHCLADNFFSRITAPKCTKKRFGACRCASTLVPLCRSVTGNSRLWLVACDCSDHSSPELRPFSAKWQNGLNAGPIFFARARSQYPPPTDPLAHTPCTFAPMPLSRSRSGPRVRPWLALYWSEHSPELRHFQYEMARWPLRSPNISRASARL